MGAKCCPHCGSERCRACHWRKVETTPTRDSGHYPLTPYPDHAESGLYAHGPDDAPTSLWYAAVDALYEAVVTESESTHGVTATADHLTAARHRAILDRSDMVEWLAMHPGSWGVLRLMAAYRGVSVERRAYLAGLVQSATRKRRELAKASLAWAVANQRVA